MCEYMLLMDIIQLGFYEFMNCFVFSNGQIWYHSNLLGEVHRGKSRRHFAKRQVTDFGISKNLGDPLTVRNPTRWKSLTPCGDV